MEPNQCVCGAGLAVGRDLCGECLKRYTDNPDEWPEWVRYAVVDRRRDRDADRKGRTQYVPDWADVPPLDSNLPDLRFPPPPSIWRGESQPERLTRRTREVLDRAYIRATTTTREGSATNRVHWPDSAWSFRLELEAWELGGIRW
jgi:hypothetical protein